MDTRIKICGITREADLATAIKAGANAVGFVLFEKSPRYIKPIQARALIERVPAFVTPVVLLVNQPLPPELLELHHVVYQYHGDESPEACEKTARPYIKALRIKPSDKADHIQKVAQTYRSALGILLDADSPSYGGSGQHFDWNQVPQHHSFPIILAGGLTPDNVQEAIKLTHPFAVDVSSGVEISPGIKDPKKILAFIKAVRQTNRLSHENST